MSVQIPTEILERAPLARVLPCFCCAMEVHHASLEAAITFADCPHLMFVCKGCSRVLSDGIIQACAARHVDQCVRRIVPATPADIPPMASS